MKKYLLLLSLNILVVQSAFSFQTLEEKIGQMLIIGFRGTTIGESDAIYKDITINKIGGVVLYDTDIAKGGTVRNIESKAQLAALTESLKKISKTPLLIAIDQEGGRVRRLKPQNGFDETKSHLELGKINNLEQTYAEASKIASMLSSEGINLNFAPCTDVATNPRSPIIGTMYRSFSDNAETVYLHSKEFIKAHHDRKIISTIKHFPGYGSATGVKHNDVIDVSKTWNEVELEPYKKLISDKMVDAIMVSHIYNSYLDAEYPASLSEKVVTDLLRKKLKFDGVIIGESPQSTFIIDQYGLNKAIELQVLAGVDVLQFANNIVYDEAIASKAITVIANMVKNGKITEQRIDESYNRIMKLKKNL
jgi:beta-N-acetylhexosaminidase